MNNVIFALIWVHDSIDMMLVGGNMSSERVRREKLTQRLSVFALLTECACAGDGHGRVGGRREDAVRRLAGPALVESRRRHVRR